MRFNRKKIVMSIIILGALLFTFWYVGNVPGLQEGNIKPELKKEVEVGHLEKEAIDENPEEIQEELENELEEVDEKIEDKEIDENKYEEVEHPKEHDEKISKTYSESMGMEIDPETGKDKYLTDPVPEGKPIPIEPQKTEITDVDRYCTLSVRCDTILDNIDWLNPEKVELVPEDGVIFATKKVKFYEGESVFNLLLREMKKEKIHMEFSNTPMYSSAYIEGINNLYEFDCGELSGWMYRVNGWFPNYGVSRYLVQEGDKIELIYTCDLGRDIGGGFAAIGGE